MKLDLGNACAIMMVEAPCPQPLSATPGAALQALDDAVKRRQTDDLRPEAVRFLHVADVQHQMIDAARVE
jgi:hypothetical protein